MGNLGGGLVIPTKQPEVYQLYWEHCDTYWYVVRTSWVFHALAASDVPRQLTSHVVQLQCTPCLL